MWVLAKIQVRWKYLENKMRPQRPQQLREVASRKSAFGQQRIGLDRSVRTEALRWTQSRALQSLPQPRRVRSAFLLARALAQSVGLDRSVRTEALRWTQSRALQSLPQPRRVRSAFLLARALAQSVGLERSLRIEALLWTQSRPLQSLAQPR